MKVHNVERLLPAKSFLQEATGIGAAVRKLEQLGLQLAYSGKTTTGLDTVSLIIPRTQENLHVNEGRRVLIPCISFGEGVLAATRTLLAKISDRKVVHFCDLDMERGVFDIPKFEVVA